MLSRLAGAILDGSRDVLVAAHAPKPIGLVGQGFTLSINVAYVVLALWGPGRWRSASDSLSGLCSDLYSGTGCFPMLLLLVWAGAMLVNILMAPLCILHFADVNQRAMKESDTEASKPDKATIAGAANSAGAPERQEDPKPAGGDVEMGSATTGK